MIEDSAFGLMFHSFHGSSHPKMTGTIDGQCLERILEHASQHYRLHDALEWAEKARNGTLQGRDICLTFDDGLACQYDIALPVLEKFNCTAFWFCPGAPLTGVSIPSDIHKHFIATSFNSFDEFYDEFFETCIETSWKDAFLAAISEPQAVSYLSEWTFYTRAERSYRFVRDIKPGEVCCNEVIDMLMLKKGVKVSDLVKQLWLKPKNLIELEAKGHVVGLHSYSHPMRMDLLAVDLQEAEYRKNSEVLSEVLRKPPETVSHPCNAFTDQTIDILRDLNISIGFRADMNPPITRNLDYRRIDHMYYLDEMYS